jgi:hypothetical protein
MRNDDPTGIQEIRQKDSQTFHQFQEEYSAIEDELPYNLPATFRVSAFLNSLKYDLRRQVISMGVPKTRLSRQQISTINSHYITRVAPSRTVAILRQEDPAITIHHRIFTILRPQYHEQNFKTNHLLKLL